MAFPARRSSLLLTPTAPTDIVLTLTGVIAVSVLGAFAPISAQPLSGLVATTNLSSVSTTPSLTGITLTANRGTASAIEIVALTGKQATTAISTLTVPGANVQSACNDFRVQLLNGRHAFGPSVIRSTTAADTFKVALYYTTSSRNPSNISYDSTGEVSSSGTNYPAGGIALTNTVPPTNTGGIAYWTPSLAAVFSNVTITTPFDCMVLYNDTSVAKLAVAVFVFGPQVITGDFTLQFAPNNLTTGLIQLTGGVVDPTSTVYLGLLYSLLGLDAGQIVVPPPPTGTYSGLLFGLLGLS